MKRRALLTGTVAWLGATTLLAAPATSAAERWEALRARLRAEQIEQAVPALLLVILDDRKPVLIAAERLDGARPFGADTPFRWGSITKTVTALAVLEAARGHDIDLDTPVTRWLDPPPYDNPWAPGAPVRLGQLLELSAGLPDLSAAQFDDNTPWTLAQALARQQPRLLWPPGLQHSYSNVAPGYAAAVLERITGRSYERAVGELVFGPLRMGGAGFEPDDDLPGGFSADGATEIPYWHMTFRAFGALNATPTDLAGLLAALLDDGRQAGRQAVGPTSVARMFESHTTLGAAHGLEIGYGAGLYGWVRDGHLWHGHGGDADGYRSRFGLLRHHGRGYAIGINVDDPRLLRRLQRLVETALTEDLPPREPPPAVALDPALLERYTGRYYPSSSRFAVDRWRGGAADMLLLEARDGLLRARRGRREWTLVPVAAGRFRRAQDPAVSVVIGESDGVTYLQGELGNFLRLGPGACPDFLAVCPGS